MSTPSGKLPLASSATGPSKPTPKILKDYAAGSLGKPLTLTGHTSYVSCLTVLPDNRLVSGLGDNTLKIWDVASQQCLATLSGHTSHVFCLTVLPDGRLVSGSYDKTLKIWDVASQQCLATLSGHTKSVYCLTVLPDSRLVSGAWDNTLKIWDVTSLQCLATLTGHTSWVNCLSVLPDGRLVSGADDKTLKIWDVASQQCLATLAGHTAGSVVGGVQCLTVLPDGRLVSGAADETLKIWDVASQQCLATLVGHTSKVRCLTVLPDGRLVSGSGDGILKIWDVASQQCLATLTGSGGYSLTMLPDGRLVTGGAFGTLKIWDFPALSDTLLPAVAVASHAHPAIVSQPDIVRPSLLTQEKASPPPPVNKVSVAKLPLASSATSPSKPTPKILKDYAAGSLGEPLTLMGHTSYVYCLTVLPDGRLVSGSTDKTLKIWDVASQQCLATLSGHTGSIYSLTMLPDGRLVSGSQDNTLKIWDVASLQCLATLAGHTDAVRCLTVLPDGRLVSGSQDNTLKIWDIAKLQCLATLTGHKGYVDCLTVLPDGRLISGSWDYTLKIWDVASLQCLVTLTGHWNTVNCLSVLPDGRLVSGSSDYTLKIWDVASQQCLVTLKGRMHSVRCLTVLPDGRLLSGSGEILEVWDVAKKKCFATFKEHFSYAYCLTVLHDGRLVTGSHDNTLKIWDFPPLSDTLLPAVAVSSGDNAAIVPQPDIARPSLPTQEKASPQPSADKTSLAKLSLTELIKACRREDADFEIAKQGLQEKLPTLKKLELFNAQLTASDIATLVELAENTGQLLLQQINFAQNGLDDDALISLFPLFQTCAMSLQILNLSNNALSETSIFGFVNIVLPELKKIYALDVTGNSLTEEAQELLKEACKSDPKRKIALKIDSRLPGLPTSPMQASSDAASSHSDSSKRESSSPSMPWAGRQLFFQAPTPEEQAQLRAELDGYAPSISGGSHYTSQTARYFDFNSDDPHLIAETLRSCIVLECTKGTKIDVHNFLAEEKIIITLSKVSTEQSKNTALLKTFEQLKIPLMLKSGTATLLWSDLRSRHVNLCISVFKAYQQGLANAERAQLTPDQMEKFLTGIKEDLLTEIQELRESQEQIAQDARATLVLQMPSPYSLR